MNRHAVYAFLRQRSIGLRVNRKFLKFINRIEPIDHPTEQSVLQVKMGLGSVRDEELAGICVRTTVSHRNHAAVSVTQIVLEFILEFAIPYRSTSFAGSGRVTCLHNEALDVAVEQIVCVIITGAQSQEVLAGFGAVVTKQLQFDVANVRVKGDRLKKILYIYRKKRLKCINEPTIVG